MKKAVTFLVLILVMIAPTITFAMVMDVSIAGPNDLLSLKNGIEKSVPARCIARGIPIEKYGKLTISISKLGDAISYDALLDTNPPRAFHKDLKDVSALSATIDEMITALFEQTVKPQAIKPVPYGEISGKEGAPEIKLPFYAMSIASIGEKLYVSDAKTLYEIKDEKPSPIWEAPGKNEILRIFTYGESIIVLTKIMNSCKSFLVAGTQTKERWNQAVIPLGNGLVSSNLIFNSTFGVSSYEWSKVKQIKGASVMFPEGLDFISAVQSEATPAATGSRIISYNRKDIMVMSSAGTIIWTDSASVGNSPQFVEDLRVDRGFTGSEPLSRYYLKPRIVMLGDKLVTLRNYQGSARIVSGFNLFEYAQLLVYTPDGNDFSISELARFPESYCTDIALSNGKIAALIVKDKYTNVQFFGL